MRSLSSGLGRSRGEGMKASAKKASAGEVSFSSVFFSVLLALLAVPLSRSSSQTPDSRPPLVGRSERWARAEGVLRARMAGSSPAARRERKVQWLRGTRSEGQWEGCVGRGQRGA